MLKNLSLLTSLIMFRINHIFLSWVFSASELKIIKLEDSTSTINMSLEFLESSKREKDNQKEQFSSEGLTNHSFHIDSPSNKRLIFIYIFTLEDLFFFLYIHGSF